MRLLGKRVWHWLNGVEDGASLAVFRIAFGIIVTVEAYRYLSKHWVESHFIYPSFNFPMLGLDIEPLAAPYIFWLFYLYGLGGILISLGLFYRLGVLLFLVPFTYLFLLDKTWYLNHFYFTILLAICLLIVPAHRTWSLDALRKRGLLAPRTTGQVPRWALVLIKGQIEIMLVWAGIVKLNADWLNGRPLNDWVPKGADGMPAFLDPIMQPILAHPDIGIISAWLVAALHLIGGPLLLVARLRPVVFIAYVAFHLSNHFLWNIGIFPWLAIFGSTIFFAADWPRRFLSFIFQKSKRLSAAARGITTPPVLNREKPQPVLASLVCLWLLSQALIPLRPYFIPRDVAWTEEGHRFSWRMKLRDKEGRVQFTLVDPETGKRRKIKKSIYLTRKQNRVMTMRADMILQFAHHLRDEWAAKHNGRWPEIYADSWASLNGRPLMPMIDPTVDLSQAKWPLFGSAPWITDFDDPWKNGIPRFGDWSRVKISDIKKNEPSEAGKSES